MLKIMMSKKSLQISSMVLLISVLLVSTVQATPLQTNQGCQTEAADYLVDILWTEYGPGIYELTPQQLEDLADELGLNEAARAAFLPLILAKGTLVAYWGPCCFKGGPQTYVDPRDNGFPNDCCKPPDFSTFPLNYLGGGEGNPCLCQNGFQPTPENRIYGDIIDIGGTKFVLLDGQLYLLVGQINPEEWVAIPLPPT